MNNPAQPWTIQVTGPALDTLSRLPGQARAAVTRFLTDTLARDPHTAGTPRVYELQGLRSARRGDYRILFTLDDDTRTIHVHRIDHRTLVYRPG